MVKLDSSYFFEVSPVLVRDFHEEVGSCVAKAVPMMDKKTISPWKKLLNSNPLTLANSTLDESKYFLMGSSSLG